MIFAFIQAEPYMFKWYSLSRSHSLALTAFFGLFFRLLFKSIELIVECVRTRDITILYFHFSRNSFCSVCFWLFLPCFDWKWGALSFKIIILFHKDSKANEYTTLKKKRTNLFFPFVYCVDSFFFQKYFRRVCNSIASHKWYEHLAALHCLFNPEMHIPIDDDDDVCFLSLLHAQTLTKTKNSFDFMFNFWLFDNVHLCEFFSFPQKVQMTFEIFPFCPFFWHEKYSNCRRWTNNVIVNGDIACFMSCISKRSILRIPGWICLLFQIHPNGACVLLL